jgi:hypothetical protein
MVWTSAYRSTDKASLNLDNFHQCKEHHLIRATATVFKHLASGSILNKQISSAVSTSDVEGQYSVASVMMSPSELETDRSNGDLLKYIDFLSSLFSHSFTYFFCLELHRRYLRLYGGHL